MEKHFHWEKEDLYITGIFFMKQNSLYERKSATMRRKFYFGREFHYKKKLYFYYEKKVL